MEPLILVVMLILLQALYFGIEVGRASYFRSYVREPKKRTLGFVLSFFSTVILIMTSIVSSLLILF